MGGGEGAAQGSNADAGRRAVGWMDASVYRCAVRSGGGGAGARGCGGGQGGQGQGELEVGVLGAQTEFIYFLRLVNRPVFLNGRELNFRGRYRDCLFQH